MKTILKVIRYMFLILIGALFLVGVPVLVANLISTKTLMGVNVVDYRNGYLFGLDVTENFYTVFRYDTETGKGDWQYFQAVDGNTSTTLKTITAYDEETVYLIRTTVVENGEEIVSTKDVVKWSVGERELESVYSAKADDDCEIERIYATEGGLYVYYTADESGHIHRVFHPWDNSGDRINEYDTGSIKAIVSIMDEDGNPCLLDFRGNVFIFKEDGSVDEVFVNEGTKDERCNANYRLQGGKFYYTNIPTGKTYVIDLSSKDRIPVEAEKTYQPAQTFDDLMLDNPVYYSDSVKAGVYVDDTGFARAAVCGEKEEIIEVLSWKPVYKYLLYALMILLALAIFYVLRRFAVFIRTKMKDSFVSSIIVVSVILMLLGFGIVRIALSLYFYANSMNELSGTSISIASTSLDALNLEEVVNVYETGHVDEDNSVWGIRLDSDTYHIATELFYKKNGYFYSADGAYSESVPLYYGNPPFNKKVYNAMEKALTTGSPVKTSYVSNGISQMVISLSLENSLGLPFVVNVYTPINTYRNIYDEETESVRLILQFILVLFFGIIFFWLRKLKNQSLELQDMISALLEGDTSKQVEEKGKTEFSDMIRRLNALTAELREEEAETSKKLEWHSSFASLGLLKQLYRETSPEVFLPGIKGEFQVNSLIVGISRLNEGREEDETTLNGLLSELTEMLGKLGGSILSVTGDSLHYVEGVGSVDCYKMVSAWVHRVNEDKNFRVNAVLRRVGAVVQVIGTEEHRALDVQILGDYGIDLVLPFARRMNIGLGVNDAFRKDVDGTNLHWRKIAAFTVGDDEFENYYESLDACSQDSRRLKTITKELFEKGIDAYVNGDYVPARTCMAQVLRQNPRDSVARVYLIESEKREGGDE